MCDERLGVMEALDPVGDDPQRIANSGHVKKGGATVRCSFRGNPLVILIGDRGSSYKPTRQRILIPSW